jgi:general secretion pathway protein N
MMRLYAHVAVASCFIVGASGAMAAISVPDATSNSEIADPGSAASPDRIKTPVATPKSERAPSGNPLWAIPLRQLSSTRERPLFSPSRRPPPPAVAAPVAPVAVRPPPKPAEPERPRLSLVGTIAGGIEGIGVFVDQDTKKSIRLKIGEAHGGWALRAIKGREAILKKDRATAVLGLPPPGGKEAGPLQLVAEAQSPPSPSLAGASNPFAAAVSGQNPFDARQRPENPFQSAVTSNPFAATATQGAKPAPIATGNPFSQALPARPANPLLGPDTLSQQPSGANPPGQRRLGQ